MSPALRSVLEGLDVAYGCDESCVVMQPYRGCRCGGAELRAFLANEREHTARAARLSAWTVMAEERR